MGNIREKQSSAGFSFNVIVLTICFCVFSGTFSVYLRRKAANSTDIFILDITKLPFETYL